MLHAHPEPRYGEWRQEVIRAETGGERKREWKEEDKSQEAKRDQERFIEEKTEGNRKRG